MKPLLLKLWRRRRLVIRTLIVLVALGLIMVNITQVFDTYTSIRDLLIRSLAFGLLPPILWAIALALAVWKKRSLLRRRLWNRWLAALLGSAVVCGVLAYFSDYNGILADATLGGWIGQDVKGPSDVLGVFRLVGMAAFVIAVAFPFRSGRLSKASSKHGLSWSLRAWKAAARLLKKTRIPRPSWTRGEKNRDSGTSVPFARRRESSDRSTITVRKAPPPTVTGRPLSTWQPQEQRMPERADRPVSLRGRAPSRPSAPENPAKHSPEPGNEATHRSMEGWPQPPLSLLTAAPKESDEPPPDHDGTARLIERTLGDYGIEVEVAEVKPGPVVTMFGLVPGWKRRSREVKEKTADGKPLVDENGRAVVRSIEDNTRVRVDSIVAREKDLALALAAPSLRIEAPIPGASLVGIEVPNAKPAVVTLRSVMESEAFQPIRSKSKLALALGRGSGGEEAVADLARMPHLLIAGSTGSGKSVCINSVIACIVMHSSPWETRMLLIDPKRVELTPYNGIPHLLIPVVVEVETAVQALKGMIREMQERYKRMEEVGARNIEGFNRRLPPEDRMPLLVVCVDELADLMMSAPYDIERSIIKLAQLGRATGIHLVVATQRPSVDVVTGLIKANFPSRISFAVASQVDSRTILDSVGAEKLLGRGDMLYQPQDAPKPRRIQGAYISDNEVEELVGYWSHQQGPPPPEIPILQVDESEETGPSGGDMGDELFLKAYDLATHYNRLSTSLLQRRLRIGYPRAARLMDLLEEEGVVGRGEAGKSREVLVSTDKTRNQRG
jgi:S-DNA-T family DNA segregation ATPase FtsK/SpoIIIE